MCADHSKIGLVSKRLIFKTLILAVCFCLWGSQAIAAENPLAVVKTGTDQVLNILKQNPQDTPARSEKIRAVVDQYFDFEGMSRLAVGQRWNNQPPEKQQQFARDFSRLLFGTYIGDIKGYANQRITYTQRQMGQDHAVVDAVISDQSGPVTLRYSLHLKNGNWRAFDVSVQGMSLAINYRSQFDPILSRGSFDNLLATLRSRVAQVCGSNRC